ncbi:MAG: flagellin [Acidothermus sp.]|nr:flagellin [Acidothermus sp.]
MGLRINTNVDALDAYRNLSMTQSKLSDSLQKLSSGYRINKAADDAAGLSISQKLQAQIGGLQQAVKNAQDGINVVQTADGALNEVSAILQRMNVLAVQAANGGSQDADAQAAAQAEIVQLNQTLDSIANTTKFGQNALLSGSYTGVFQVGADNNAADQITVDLSSTSSLWTTAGITGVTSTGLGTDTVDVSTTAGAQSAIATIATAIKGVSTVRATLGAYQNQFQHVINNLNVTVENLQASNSAIRDTDMAQEMVNFTQAQVLQQAGVSMLAQANTETQAVLKLLQ